MSAIGDLLYLIRGDGKQLQVDVKREGTKAGQTLGQSISANMRKSFSGGELGKGLVQGLGLAGALGGAALVTRAVSGVINILGDAKDAALAEEKSIGGLDAALEANVEGWDGNRDAIEKVLQSRMRLGFSDDEQRESLKLLVGATKDSARALDVQRTAMDLARLKNISLAQASEALVKVEGGQFRILKSLGIQLPKNATAQDALNAVQKVAAGQAEKLAKLRGGKMLAAEIKLGEQLEKLGDIILPLVVEGMTWLADTTEDLIGPVGEFLENTRKEFEQLALAGHAVHDFFALLLEPISDTRDALFKAGEEAQRFRDSAVLAGTAVGDVGGAAKGSVKAIDTVTGATGTLGETAADTADDVGDLADKLRDDLVSAVEAATDALTEAIHGPAEFTGQLAELEQQLIDDQKELHKLEAIKNPTAEQRRDILSTKGSIAETQAEILKTRVQFALLDGTGMDAIIVEVSKLATKTGKAGDEALTLLHNLQHVRNTQVLPAGNPATRGTTGRGRATGGFVWPGETFRVGEGGREERLHMFEGGGGYVEPLAAPAARASRPNVTIYNPEPRAADEDIVRIHRRMAAVGL